MCEGLRVKTRAGESEGGILMRAVRGGWEQGNAEDGIVPASVQLEQWASRQWDVIASLASGMFFQPAASFPFLSVS